VLYKSTRTRLVSINLCLVRHVPIRPGLIRALVIRLVSYNRGLALYGGQGPRGWAVCQSEGCKEVSGYPAEPFAYGANPYP